MKVEASGRLSSGDVSGVRVGSVITWSFVIRIFGFV